MHDATHAASLPGRVASNGLAIAGLCLGIAGSLFGLIPILGYVTAT